MKQPIGTTFILITANRIARADFAGDSCSAKSGSRPPAMADAVRAALALGGKAAKETWVLSTQVWMQELRLNTTQTAGLSQEQLRRALAFEAEPFSGIPVAESATGYRDEGNGTYTVAQISQQELTALASAVTKASGHLAGISHPCHAPEDDAAMFQWWQSQPARLPGLPLIMPPAPAPSPHRFLITGISLAIAALAFLFLFAGWNGTQRKNHERKNTEFITLTRELDATNKQNETLRQELSTLEKQQKQREQIFARRGALLSALNALAKSCPEDVLVSSLTPEGPSTIVVSGISLEAGVVDEMSIVLTSQLRSSGWTAQPRSKIGRKSTRNGGPWEFTLALTHEEATAAQPGQTSQHFTE